jgi:transposase-like protein
MRKPARQSYPAACKERAVTRAVESAQPLAQPARDLGVNENTWPTWMGKYPRPERQEKPGNAAHLDEALQRLRTENARLQAARAL